MAPTVTFPELAAESIARVPQTTSSAPLAQNRIEMVIDVNGAALTLEPSGAVWWAARRTLIVSDLHFEKGSSFAARGVPLPPYDTRATLERLEAAMSQRRPARLISLGDTFHDRTLDARMAAEDWRWLADLVARCEEWVWITGNHDPEPPRALGGRGAHELRDAELVFRHEPVAGPEAGEAVGEVAGHLHPCARVSASGRAVRRKCFVADENRLILPSLGAFTGGLNVRDAAFAPLFAAPPTAYVLGQERVWPVSRRHLTPDRGGRDAASKAGSRGRSASWTMAAPRRAVDQD